ncbi:hypothetical protein [Brucella pseudintermedia]|uniref:hypothetical protein n=1 Tax=Brucella pseudintermedia TaxID=370111 RepID=UPI0032081AB8
MSIFLFGEWVVDSRPMLRFSPNHTAAERRKFECRWLAQTISHPRRKRWRRGHELMAQYGWTNLKQAET